MIVLVFAVAAAILVALVALALTTEVFPAIV